MADQIFVDPGTGGQKIPVKTRTDGDNVDWPVSLIAYGVEDSEQIVDPTHGFPVSVLNTSIAVTDNSGSLTVDDGGGSLTVDGSVAITNSSIAVTDNSGSLTVDDGGLSLTVDGSVSATQSGNWSVRNQDGSGNALASSTSTPAGSEQALIVRNIPSGTQTVSGSVSATQSGTWNIATLTTITNAVPINDNSGSITVDDGGSSLTVDGTVAISGSVTVTDGSGSLTVDGTVTANAGTGFPTVYTEDAAASGGETGLFLLGVRRDAGTSPVSADGDFHSLVFDNAGNLKVTVTGGSSGDGALLDGVSSSIKATVLDYTNSNPLAVRLTDTNGDYVGAGAGTQYTEDAASASDPIGTQLIARRRDSLSSETSADGDNTALNSTAKGELYVKHVDTINVADGGSSLTVDGTIASTQSGTWNIATVSTVSTITNVVHVDDNSSSLTVDDGGSSITVDGSVNAVQSGTWNVGTLSTITNVVHIDDNSSTISIDDGGGTVTVDGTITASNTAGDIAHDSADSGNPLKIGAKATTSLHGLTLVADADRTNLFAGIDGVLITRENANLESTVSGNASNTDGSSTQVIAAAGSGVKVYVTDVTLTNTSSTDIYVELKDGSTAKWTFPVPKNGGCTHRFGTPLGGTANTAWNFDPSSAATTVYCSVAGFKSKI